jgi:hypothetical protein
MAFTSALLTVAAMTGWTVPTLQAYAEQYVARKHAND